MLPPGLTAYKPPDVLEIAMISYLRCLVTGAALLVTAFAVPAKAQTPLDAPGALPEKTFGQADAPVTVIEYASLTCHHCRDFHVRL